MARRTRWTGVLVMTIAFRALLGAAAGGSPAPPFAPADPANYQTILEDDCSSLAGWTVTGNATVSGGRFRLNGSSVTIKRSISLPSDTPSLLTVEVEAINKSAFGFNLDHASPRVLSLVLSPAEATSDTAFMGNNASATAASLAYDATKKVRLYILHDPVSGIGRAWIQDDGTSGPRFIGELAATQTPQTLRLYTGSASSNDVYVDNIVVAPVYGLAHGDSRVAGHGMSGRGFDPWPDYYAAPDRDYSWPLKATASTGAHFVNAGIGSTGHAANAARLSDMLLFEPQVVVIGSSNMLVGETLTDMKSAITSMISEAQAAGAAVVVMEFPPNDDGTRLADRLALNAWINANASALGYGVATIYSTLSDSDQLGATYDDGDGVHLTPAGAAVQSAAVVSLL